IETFVVYAGIFLLPTTLHFFYAPVAKCYIIPNTILDISLRIQFYIIYMPMRISYVKTSFIDDAEPKILMQEERISYRNHGCIKMRHGLPFSSPYLRPCAIASLEIHHKRIAHRRSIAITLALIYKT